MPGKTLETWDGEDRGEGFKDYAIKDYTENSNDSEKPGKQSMEMM